MVCERFFQDCGKNSSKQELKEGGADAARGRHSPLQKWADVRPGLLQQALRSHHTDLLPGLAIGEPMIGNPRTHSGGGPSLVVAKEPVQSAINGAEKIQWRCPRGTSIFGL